MTWLELPRADHSNIWDKRSRIFPLCVAHNRYLTHPLSYILSMRSEEGGHDISATENYYR